MASNTTLSRYRPALCVLAALAAGYTIYYVHSTQQASIASREPQQRIRRRQANNRRRARPAQIEELISNQTEEVAFLDYPESVWDSKRLWDEWQACPDRLEESYLLPRNNWPNPDIPGTLLLRKEFPSLRWLMLEFGVSIQDAQTILKEYEETMLKTFICQKVPPRCTLVDPGGIDMFVRAFSSESESLSYPSVIRYVIQLFNAGAYDHWRVRKDTYARLHVRPPETRSSIELDIDYATPEEQQIEYLDDPEGFERLNELLDDADNVSESAQSWHEDDSDESKKEGAQTLLNMLYHIAEDQARREGFVHRGISCKSCHSSPIHGLRYKCVNCVDFDLCETCEAMQQHPKTHLFLKIRIPAPSYTNSKKPQALWYPGKAVGLPNNLKPQRNKQLSEASGFTENEIEALWDQFKNLAATPWPIDPMEFCWAINSVTFHKCFALSTGSAPRGHPNSLIYDRLFRLYDTNKDGLIGFEEFVNGMAASKSRNPGTRMRRIFEGFDFDEDGFISRKDVLAMFKACYALSKDLARDLFTEYEIDLLEGGSLRDNITGNQPISSAFTGMYEASSRHRRAGQGKVRDANGDLIVVDSGGILSKRNDDEGDLDQIIGDLGEISVYGTLSDTAKEMKAKANAQRPNEDILPISINTDGTFSSPQLVNPHPDQENNSPRPPTSDDANNNENDRRWIFFRSNHQDRKVVRQEAIADRNSRARFYDNESSLPADSVCYYSRQGDNASLQSRGQDYSSAKPKEDTSTLSLSAKGETSSMEFRTPPPMPEDIGQEMLFQITRECINELIDPLFKHREDLTLCFERFKEFLEPCNEHLVMFRRIPRWDNLDMNQYEAAMDCLAWFQLHRYLKARAEGLITSGFKGNYPLADFLHSLSNPESSYYRNNQADKDMIHNHVKKGQEVPFTLDYPREPHFDKMERDRDSINQQGEGETYTTPSLSSDISQPEESEIEYPAAAIELHETVSLFNENDLSLEEKLSKQTLESLLEESGYSIITENLSISQSDLDSSLDPTLPQNRPNTLSDIINSSSKSKSPPHTSQPEKLPVKNHKIMLPEPFNPKADQFIPPVSSEWSNEFMFFVHFLTILKRAQSEDVERGGAGRINFEEYSDIVGGTAATDLEFLGQWIDMQAV